MKIVMLSNFINPHQAPVADELYNTPGVEYWFVETMKLPEEQRNLGYPDLSSRPYVIQSYKSVSHYDNSINLINNADVVIVGSAPETMIVNRLNANKLTFRYAERYFKRHPWYFPNPLVWWNLFLRHTRYRNKNVYMLAASAYTANDISHFFAYPNKCYKWGYFPAVNAIPSDISSNSDSYTSNVLSLMWCARFLKWKHPELPVRLAARLKSEGYKFILNMYGNGMELESIKLLVKQLGVDDVVTFKGNKPNAEIIKSMSEHDIFLFTSDRNEGWGAVLNESMSQGCAVVASDMIGAAPFLIEDDRNGLLFKSEDIDSLYIQVKRLLDDKVLRAKISKNAIQTMREVWNPKIAAERLLHLVENILQNKDTDYEDGPCSKAYPYKQYCR